MAMLDFHHGGLAAGVEPPDPWTLGAYLYELVCYGNAALEVIEGRVKPETLRQFASESDRVTAGRDACEPRNTDPEPSRREKTDDNDESGRRKRRPQV